jgi:signal peptidase I
MMICVAVAGLAVSAVAGVWRLRDRHLVVTVRGLSMTPTFEPGDRLLVRRVEPRGVHTGQVVVVDLPHHLRPMPPGITPEESLRQRRVIKRVAAVAGEPVPDGVDAGAGPVPAGHLVLLGDNPLASGDSRL